jgi:hypothetical protein
MVRVSRVTALVVLTSSVLIAYGAACSSTTTGSSGPNDGPTHGTDASSSSPGKDASTGGSDAGGGQDAAPGDDASTGDNPCAKLSGDQCGSCCEDHHQNGANTFYNAFFGCLCGAQGKCQTQCAQTDCSDQQDAALPQQGDPCDQCEMTNAPDDGGGACGPSISAACSGSADCKALLDCWDQCP